MCSLNNSLVDDTDFDPHVGTFQNAWSHIKYAIEEANKRGISVLIGKPSSETSCLKLIYFLDLHAAPGKQNHDSHGGTSTPPTFFSKSYNQAICLKVLNALIRTLTSLKLPNIVGIEVLNEPAPPSDTSLQKFYDKAIETLAEVDPSIPVYLGECWKPDAYADWVVKKRRSLHPQQMLVLDHHLYRCFTSQDIQKSVAEHTSSLTDEGAETPKTFARVSEKLRKVGADLVVGEWSAALNPGSLNGAAYDEQRKYAEAQLALFEKYCAGSYFWTYKKGVSGDKGWSFRDAVESGTMPRWIGGLRLRSVVEESPAETERRRTQRDAEAEAGYCTH